ncbi:MAG TPA: glutaredoxin family protein [Symbiobacteriaceae bacterium]|nr:glutaredoxin family protein [Symbiobacteriaceae bacterium]
MGDMHVTLYSGPETEELDRARRYLKDLGVQYEEKSILDPGARGELRHKAGEIHYPAIDVNGHFVKGFFEQKWRHLLDHNAIGRTDPKHVH